MRRVIHTARAVERGLRLATISVAPVALSCDAKTIIEPVDSSMVSTKPTGENYRWCDASLTRDQRRGSGMVVFVG